MLLCLFTIMLGTPIRLKGLLIAAIIILLL